MRLKYLVPLTLLFPLNASAQLLQGRVVGITDGDTIKVLDAENQQHKVRLTGIDAPEKRQAFGQQSKQSLSAMVFRQVVTVDWHKLDRYKRELGKVLLNGNDVNLEQIRRGMAWHFKRYEREQPSADRTTYAATEQQARASGVGVWRQSDPVPPWEFRKKR